MHQSNTLRENSNHMITSGLKRKLETNISYFYECMFAKSESVTKPNVRNSVQVEKPRHEQESEGSSDNFGNVKGEGNEEERDKHKRH